MRVFSLDKEPAGRRLDAWQAMISDTFVSLDCAFGTETAVSGSVTSTEAGDVLLSRVSTVAQTVDRTPCLIRRDDAEVMLVSFQLKGEGVVAQDGRETRLHAGDFALYDSTRPYRLHFDGPFDQLVLHMPRALVRRSLGEAHSLTARSFRSDRASFAAASGCLMGLGSSLGAMVPEGADRVGTAALDLVSAAILDAIGTPLVDEQRTSAGLKLHAFQVIDRHFDDASLTTPDIARRVGVSTRRLQEIFAEDGMTPMKRLWERRLTEADRLLADTAFANRSITEIGLSCGFADSAQFSRRFRERFAESPRSRRIENRPGRISTKT
ncbi:MAG: helix-turn-helix domain-containing protein [Pseudomonadota bacterium]